MVTWEDSRLDDLAFAIDVLVDQLRAEEAGRRPWAWAALPGYPEYCGWPWSWITSQLFPLHPIDAPSVSQRRPETW